MPTKDKRFIWVDMYARWRITDPLKFFQRLRDERGAQSRLDDILDGETRNAVASFNLIELVRSSNRPADTVPIENEEERIVLEEIAKGRRAIAAGILEAAQGPDTRPRHRGAGHPAEAHQLRRRGREGRVRADDRRAAADRRTVPVRGAG